MNLATRCPSCGTVFRVVRDQLKVSEGWVRCGRCAEVFNAAERLFELESAALGTAAAPQETSALARAEPVADKARATTMVPAEVAPQPRPQAQAPDIATAPAPDPAAVPAPAPAAATAPWAETAPGARLAAAAAPADAAAALAPGPAPVQVASATSDAAADPLAVPANALEPAASAQDPVIADMAQAPQPTDPAAAASMPTPEFMRRAERAARRRQPARRGVLALLAALLALLLVGQVGFHYRDHLAAGWPATRPVLQASCDVLGCRIEAPRRIDALQVDSSGLARVPDSTLYRLSLVVRNKAPTPARMPAVDLSLTDAQGLTLARRVLSAADLGQPAPSLAAGAELPLQATLDLGDRRVSGYTVELFYP